MGRQANAKYCSVTCNNHAKTTKYMKSLRRICEQCGEEYAPTRHNQKFCSTGCVGDSNRKFLDIPDCIEGADRKLDKNLGYVRVYCPMHREANTWGYVYEHRLVAEQMIGRDLVPGEIVHHKNRKRWDNRPENLEVLTKEEHGLLHATEDRNMNRSNLISEREA